MTCSKSCPLAKALTRAVRRKLVLNWKNAAAKTCDVEVSLDGSKWTTAAQITDGKPGLRTIDLNGVKARYIRIAGKEPTTGHGCSLFEIEASGAP